MKLEEVKEQEMYVLVAPDGTPQLTTLAPDFATCLAIVKLLHKKGIGQSYHQLCKVDQFEILPVVVTITQMGDAKAGFQWAKQKAG